jgi:uncharacterized membrane protein
MLHFEYSFVVAIITIINIIIIITTTTNCEMLGLLPVPYPSRWNGSFHPFFGHSTFLLLLLADILVLVLVTYLSPFPVSAAATF